MPFSAPLSALATLAAWLVVGIVYLWHIRRFRSRIFLRRTRNYLHFSHVLILIVCQIIGMLIEAAQFSAGGPFVRLVSWLGLCFGAGGFALCLWAKKTLGPFWDRHASIQLGHRLIRTGPYASSRNPIFLGQFGMFAGAGLASLNGVALICCAPALWSYYRRLRIEESLLAEHFGSEYESYRAEVASFWPVPKLLRARNADMPVVSDLLKTGQKV